MTEATAVPAAPVDASEVDEFNERPEVDDLAFRARALAQAHALSPAATQYRRWRIDRDAPTHPAPELSSWAATAFLTGYCVRCVEQSLAGADSEQSLARTGTVEQHRYRDRGNGDRETEPDGWLTEWERGAATVADMVLSGVGATRLDHALVAATLDNVIGREIEKRNEHVREQLSPEDWAQFETFIAWWVMHGYAIGAVESDCPAVGP